MEDSFIVDGPDKVATVLAVLGCDMGPSAVYKTKVQGEIKSSTATVAASAAITSMHYYYYYY